MEERSRLCYFTTMNLGDPNWYSPEYTRQKEWSYINETARQVLEEAGFYDVSGLYMVVVGLKVGSPCPPKTPIRIKSSKAVGAMNVDYFVKASELPSNNDESGWKAAMISYLADGIDRVLAKYKLDRSGIRKIQTLGSEPFEVTEALDEYWEDNLATVEIVLPHLAKTAVELKEELALYQDYADAVTTHLEERELARWISEESTQTERIIAFKTSAVEDTVSAIKEVPIPPAVPNDMIIIQITEDGSSRRLEVIGKKAMEPGD